eukprot:gene18073-21593_t
MECIDGVVLAREKISSESKVFEITPNLMCSPSRLSNEECQVFMEAIREEQDILVAGVDSNGASLYYVNSKGVFTKLHFKAIGAGSVDAQENLEKKYSNSFDIYTAAQLSLSTLKQVTGVDLTSTNVEVGYISFDDAKFKLYTQEELQEIIDINIARW